MNNKNFWDDIESIIADGFTPEGLKTLDYYADLYKSGRWIFKRFSPKEQLGCSEGGSAHVIATILAGAKTKTDPGDEKLSDFKRELKQATQQAQRIEEWARSVGLWIDNVDKFLWNSFGQEIKIIVEQAYIEGCPLDELEIRSFVENLGFELKNPKNWTYATPNIYLSDMHDKTL